jgi:twitching motility protein PilT
MTLESLITTAKESGASDLHLEAGLPAALRVRGVLRTIGEPVAAETILGFARSVIEHDQWPQFLERRSFDLSKVIQGVRCRINILQSSRGVGFVIRLLSTSEATLETQNLHPDFKKFLAHANGLILVSGPTGSGKTSTLAALIQEINLAEPRHIVTIESPIEYSFRPRRAYIRQREVGRDTPSFEQALLDALREDPDVLMVGEMREPETMRLTLNAAETGHLVLATVHSSNCAEALQRIVSAFPSEIQSGVAAELADCLVAVIAQRFQFRADLNIRVPECEVLVSTHPVKNFVRNREFFKIPSLLETGADHGMWTFQRYQTWLQKRKNFYVPPAKPESIAEEPTPPGSTSSSLPPLSATKTTEIKSAEKKIGSTPVDPREQRIEIEPGAEFGKILKKPEDQP